MHKVIAFLLRYKVILFSLRSIQRILIIYRCVILLYFSPSSDEIQRISLTDRLYFSVYIWQLLIRSGSYLSEMLHLLINPLVLVDHRIMLMLEMLVDLLAQIVSQIVRIIKCLQQSSLDCLSLVHNGRPLIPSSSTCCFTVERASIISTHLLWKLRINHNFRWLEHVSHKGIYLSLFLHLHQVTT